MPALSPSSECGPQPTVQEPRLSRLETSRRHQPVVKYIYRGIRCVGLDFGPQPLVRECSKTVGCPLKVDMDETSIAPKNGSQHTVLTGKGLALSNWVVGTRDEVTKPPDRDAPKRVHPSPTPAAQHCVTQGVDNSVSFRKEAKKKSTVGTTPRNED